MRSVDSSSSALRKRRHSENSRRPGLVLPAVVARRTRCGRARLSPAARAKMSRTPEATSSFKAGKRDLCFRYRRQPHRPRPRNAISVSGINPATGHDPHDLPRRRAALRRSGCVDAHAGSRTGPLVRRGGSGKRDQPTRPRPTVGSDLLMRKSRPCENKPDLGPRELKLPAVVAHG